MCLQQMAFMYECTRALNVKLWVFLVDKWGPRCGVWTEIKTPDEGFTQQPAASRSSFVELQIYFVLISIQTTNFVVCPNSFPDHRKLKPFPYRPLYASELSFLLSSPSHILQMAEEGSARVKSHRILIGCPRGAGRVLDESVAAVKWWKSFTKLRVSSRTGVREEAFIVARLTTLSDSCHALLNWRLTHSHTVVELTEIAPHRSLTQREPLELNWWDL